VDVVCDKEGHGEIAGVGNSLINRPVQMVLEDGRSLTVFILGYELRQQNLAEGGVAPCNYLGCYFVAIIPPHDLAKLLTDPASFFPNF
jgi:hypothetical protein